MIWMLACAMEEEKPVQLEDTDQPEDTATTEPEDLGPALVFTLTPSEASVGDIVTIEIAVENFEIVDPTSVPAPEVVPGEGHIHISFDGEYLAAVWELSAEIDTTGAEPGEHEIDLGLQTSEHGELDPPVHATATLTLN